MLSNCPKCEKTIPALTINGLDGKVSLVGGATWKCIALCCPYCSTVLGAQIDPIAIKSDIVNGLMAALRK